MEYSKIISKLLDEYDKDEMFLITPISETAGFFVQNNRLLFVEFDNKGDNSEGIETQYLNLQMHIKIKAVKNYQLFKSGYYNYILCKSMENNDLRTFIRLCELYACNNDRIPFKTFFYSLISLFQLPMEQSYMNSLGLYGELKLILDIWNEYNIDLSPRWHIYGSFSKYDFSNGKVGLEVKTTSTLHKEITVKHDQIFDNGNCILVTIFCEENECGESLEQLVEEIREKKSVFRNINFAINLEKEIRRVSPRDYTESFFCVKERKLFKTEEINPFMNIPDNVHRLSYQLEIDDELKMCDEKKVFEDFNK